MTDRADEIISIFLNKRTKTLKDSEISHALVAQGIPLHIDDVRRHVQPLSPALFQLSFNKDIGMTITVDPQIDICQAFLAGRCHHTVKTCNKLHICRDFGHCARPKCTFPHDFNRGINREIVEQFNCQSVNCQLLVQLIRLGKSSGRLGSFSHPSPLPPPHPPPPVHRQVVDLDRQVDVSFPSVNLTQNIDMEIIELLLSTDGIRIEKKLGQGENDYFRRETIQLAQTRDLDKLLSTPVRIYEKSEIKFKRTKQFVDRTSFKLKISSADPNDRVTEARIRLYASLLLQDNNPFHIYDLSTINEQIFLVQSSNEINFDRVRQQYESKRQLKNSEVTLTQIYECDTVTIQNLDEKKVIRYNDIERLIPSVQQNIFTFDFTSQHSVEVEFLTIDACRQWLSSIDQLKSRFQVSIIPVVDDVEQNEMPSQQHATESFSFNLNSSVTSKAQTATIKLRTDWALVANHRVFGQEYKDYIHEQLGGEIEINSDWATYTGSFPRLSHSATNEAILVNKTNNYMQKLKYWHAHDLKPHHAKILHDNADIIAFNRLNKGDYLVAGKAEDILRVKAQLFPRTNSRPLMMSRADSTTNIQSNDAQTYSLLMPRRTKDGFPQPLMRSLTQTTFNQYDESPIVASASSLPPPSFYSIKTSEEMSMLSISIFEERLQQHLHETFHVKIIVERPTIDEKSKGGKSRMLLKVFGQPKDVESALEDLHNLFSSLRTRKFDDKTSGNWTKIDDATQMIQHHLLAANWICSCQRISSTSIYINYFDVNHPQFGIDEQNIEDLINHQFTLATIPYNKQSSTAKFTKEWTSTQEKIRQRDDYQKEICLSDEGTTMYLFGLTKLVKEYREVFEQLKNQYIPQTCKITLSEKQINYLKYVAKSDFNKFEKQCKSDGCEISLVRLQQLGEFVAPPDMHEKIKSNLEALVQITEVTFAIKGNPFEILINKEPDRILSLVRSKCYFEKQIQTNRVHIDIPQAQIADPDESTSPAAAAAAASPQATTGTSLTIGKSSISINVGDLATQTVDVIVVCSTSDVLRKDILSKAGSRVQTEYEVRSSKDEQRFSTSNGSLPCKKIYFLQWKVDQSDPNSLQSSVSTFVSKSIQYAIKNDYQTIAFPSIGCGKFGFDPSRIAQYMIDEALLQLLNSTSTIIVSFVHMPNQQNVYDEFVKYLQSVGRTVPATTTKLPTKSKRAAPTRIAYEEKTVQITLISANKDHLVKCKQDIMELSRSASHTSRLTDKQDMVHWPQSTINDYYSYCLKQSVIPTLDLNKCTVDLVGPREAVNEAEKHFYQLTAETFKQASMQAVSRSVIWSVETAPASNTWEQYSFKLNAQIEDAYSKKLNGLDITNSKQETCQIDFSKMIEQNGSDIRRIRRKEANSPLPDEWDSSDQNCVLVTLQTASKEYQNVLQQFNVTMQLNYTQIIKIERVQNIRWYKQYDAHRDEFKRRYGRLDERLLFHGCHGASAKQITQECFNRAFAGAHGIAYGSGVYFHAHASYSHQYAQPSPPTGERTMFLARVLIGKTARGDQSMKVPPTGCDTTTDGQHIFVVYHDAGAYADYLITYR